MSADEILSRLSGVKRTGAGRWIAKCPAHADGHASLSIRELDDGRVLLHDFAGCSVAEILGAIGLDFGDLFPERLGHHLPPERRPFAAADALRAVAFEGLVVSCAAAALASGEPLSDLDRDRLLTAAARVEAALETTGSLS